MAYSVGGEYHFPGLSHMQTTITGMKAKPTLSTCYSSKQFDPLGDFLMTTLKICITVLSHKWKLN